MEKYLFKDVFSIKLNFLLYVPKNINEDSTLILNVITQDIGTNKESENYGTYSDSYKEALTVAESGYFSPLYKKLSEDYNNPMLIPIIPRCMALYTGYLGYDVYHENYDRTIKAYNDGWSKFNLEELENFRKLDIQISNMIKYCIAFIKNKYNIDLDDKVIATGFSASSKMVNYFSALHPDQVKMIIGGATGGLCILPLVKYNSYDLDYPLGFNDLTRTNLELFKNIPQFYYMGKNDDSDPSKPRIINDKYIIKDGGFYSLEQVHIIHDIISSDVQKRFDIEQQIYLEEGVNAIFKKYKGGHNIDDENLETDIIQFYEENIKKVIIHK